MTQDDNVGFAYTELRPTVTGDVRPHSATPIGGLLWLAAFGVTLAPLTWLASGGKLRMLAFEAGRNDAVSNETAANLVDKLGLGIGFGGAAFSLYVATTFWRKRRRAPALVIAQIIAGFFAFIISNAACASAFRLDWDVAALMLKLSAQVFVGGLWIWYFLRSRRVARTFVAG